MSLSIFEGGVKVKKIAAVFLLIAIVTVFVSCGDGDKDGNQTTLNTNQQNVESTTAGPTEAQGIVLTTDPSKMAYWGVTTGFIPTEYTESTIPTVSVPPISDNVERPIPQISQVTNNTDNTPSNNSNTNNSGGTSNNSGPTVSEITTPTDETPTEPVQRMPKSVSGTKTTSNDRKGEFVEKASIEFSANGWDGGIVSNSANVSVNYAGETFNVPCSVSSALNGDYYEIVITVSSLKIPAGTGGFTVTIPEGFVKNTLDTQYSMAVSASF